MFNIRDLSKSMWRCDISRIFDIFFLKGNEKEEKNFLCICKFFKHYINWLANDETMEWFNSSSLFWFIDKYVSGFKNPQAPNSSI